MELTGKVLVEILSFCANFLKILYRCHFKNELKYSTTNNLSNFKFFHARISVGKSFLGENSKKFPNEGNMVLEHKVFFSHDLFNKGIK